MISLSFYLIDKIRSSAINSFIFSDISFISSIILIIYDYQNNIIDIKKIIVSLVKIILLIVFIFLYELKIIKKINNCLYKCFSCNKDDNELLENQLNSESYPKEHLLIETENSKFKNEYLGKQKEKIKKENITTKLININKVYTTYKYCCCIFCCKEKKIVLRNLNLGLEPNEKFALLGFNGAGKSTLIKSIINEIDYKGEIYLFDKNLKTNFESERLKIGYCPQDNLLFENYTTKEILKFIKNLLKINTSIEEISKKFNLEKYLNTKYGNLSGGNKRKLCFAISIMKNPKLLLLDEPTTGIDPQNRKKICEIILKMKHKYNMILVTHSMEEAELLCDTVSWLNNVILNVLVIQKN